MEFDDVARWLEVAEVSEWFDWMRRELPRGGSNLPEEEKAVEFAALAIQLSCRVRRACGHLPVSLEQKLIKSTILYQCWKQQRSLHVTPWLGPHDCVLKVVDAVRYLGPVGNNGTHHLVEASNGFEYVVTISVPRGFLTEPVAGTEILCNELARLIGLTVPSATILTLSSEVLKLARPDVAWLGSSLTMRHVTQFYCGFRHVAGTGEGGRHCADNLRQMTGALALDIWTLNLSPRRFASVFNEVTGRVETFLLDHSRCLMGAGWGDFLHATPQSMPAPQGVAARVTQWARLDTWLRRIDRVNLNAIWKLAFEMPEQWYGGNRPNLADVLDKLESRRWSIRTAIAYFMQVGYLANLKVHRKPAEAPPSLDVQSSTPPSA